MVWGAFKGSLIRSLQTKLLEKVISRTSIALYVLDRKDMLTWGLLQNQKIQVGTQFLGQNSQKGKKNEKLGTYLLQVDEKYHFDNKKCDLTEFSNFSC